MCEIKSTHLASMYVLLYLNKNNPYLKFNWYLYANLCALNVLPFKNEVGCHKSCYGHDRVQC